MRYWLLKISFFALLLTVDGCIEPFSPPEVNSDGNYLVIDGFLNVSGADSTRIELRRTQNINANTGPIIETGAQLAVEEENGETLNLAETGKGVYTFPPRQFNRAGKYRLRVKTQSGEEYLSEYVGVSITPAIDSVTYKVDPVLNAAVFYVNTHDSQNRTQFYRWKFDETWEYEATYYSALMVRNDSVVLRPDNINRCWGKQRSASILLGSTVKLSSDVIKDLPINRVPIPTNKLFIKYSILVKQYGLSREAFEYWTDLAKTTQFTGSLFDVLPSQVTGNIRNVADPRLLAFGYFSAATEETTRLTISPRLGLFPRCTEPDTIPIRCSTRDAVECAANTPKLLLTYWGARADSLLVAAHSCTDCRLQGGTTERPSYW
ncbi:DUF4249 domain-containing protein [Dyadobacter fermentans]|uniref:DUF4249 domain-containing protein n=1 Tax=Dyadobacter fermentans (strain ATCC 700827 / DSM 18053 / CIP 107007 / KCTC 52180 / NS114) TaxID=471854 RepID=C6W229_DYAFD|nr:DUF4249 domain-containing protein [Dyadobacter fermentans]ACT95604.1 conserved hypothetical protein [Dyadobacter fermentans DSM 18053]